MQEVVQVLLERLGYRVILAASGGDALSLFDADPSAIHLVLADIVLPGGMNGLEVVRSIRAVRPNMPICYMTAYEKAIAQLDESGEKERCLRKPFPLEQLARMVRSALDEASPHAGAANGDPSK